MVIFDHDYDLIGNLIIDKLIQCLIQIVYIIYTMHDHQIVVHIQIKVVEHLSIYHVENLKHLHVSTILYIDNHNCFHCLIIFPILNKDIISIYQMCKKKKNIYQSLMFFYSEFNKFIICIYSSLLKV